MKKETIADLETIKSFANQINSDLKANKTGILKKVALECIVELVERIITREVKNEKNK